MKCFCYRFCSKADLKACQLLFQDPMFFPSFGTSLGKKYQHSMKI
jgi:hypothetical protein